MNFSGKEMSELDHSCSQCDPNTRQTGLQTVTGPQQDKHRNQEFRLESFLAIG